MLIGSFFGVVGSYVTGSAWMGLLFAALSGILMGLVLVTLTVGFKCEHEGRYHDLMVQYSGPGAERGLFGGADGGK